MSVNSLCVVSSIRDTPSQQPLNILCTMQLNPVFLYHFSHSNLKQELFYSGRGDSISNGTLVAAWFYVIVLSLLIPLCWHLLGPTMFGW